MDQKPILLDDNEDWRYWKGLYLDLQVKYTILSKRHTDLCKRFDTEQESSTHHLQTISDLQEKLKSLSPHPKSSPTLSINCSSIKPATLLNASDSFSSPILIVDYPDSTKLFEAFLMLSGDNDDSEIIYTYSNTDILQTINPKVITDFIFPTQPLHKSLEIQSVTQLFEMLYRNFYRDKDSFVFTLKGASTDSMNIPGAPNDSKELLYCCCVLIDDIKTKDAKILQNSYIGYCLLTYFPCFELHFDVLYRLLAIKRIERTGRVMGSTDTSYDFPRLIDLLTEKFPKPDEVSVLEAYGVYVIRPSLSVRIEIAEVEPVEHHLPEDLGTVDTVWLCPLLFSLFAFDDLMYCIFTLLQEQSIVFVSRNLGYLSSCVLGFHALLRPYSWKFITSPILPEQIKDILQAPIPLLVGIPFEHKEGSDRIMYIHLDEGVCVEKKLPVPNYQELLEKTHKDYSLFGGRACYIPNDIQEAACRRITQRIKGFLTGITEKFLCEEDSELDYSVCSFISEADAADQEFLHEFCKTQIFAGYYQETCKR